MGRPRKWDNPDEMQEAIDAYFASLNDGETAKPPTVAGLAIALGFCDRQSLQDYAKDERFSFPIKAARHKIEAWHEGRLSGTSPTGSIFWLKNHAGYTDKQEQTIQSPDGGAIVLNIIRGKADA
jgi:hypothetical protein